MSRAFKKIADPTIAKTASFRVADVSDYPDFANLRQHCPDFMVEHITEIHSMDVKGTLKLNPIPPVDVSGFPQLKNLVFNSFDIAFMAEWTLSMTHKLSLADQEKKVKLLIPRLRADLYPKIPSHEFSKLMVDPGPLHALFQQLRY